jgi:hypothetical protein
MTTTTTNTMTSYTNAMLTPTHEFAPAFTALDIYHRDQKALDYLLWVDVARGRNAGASALRPAPRTILRVPCKVPRAAMKRIVEHVLPQSLAAIIRSFGALA